MEHRRREPAPGVFRLVLPLPFPVLPLVNAYALAARDGITLIDCGIHDPAAGAGKGLEDIDDALGAAELTLEAVDRLVVTHAHADHYGLAGPVIDRTGCELWMHDADDELAAYLDPEGATARLKDALAAHGVPLEELNDLTAFENWRVFVADIVRPSQALTGGEDFTVGGRTWQVVYTPGHSRSHICLWSPSDGILISGDHMLQRVTPHIDFEHGAQDALADYLASLAEIERLEPALVLPGHGRPFEDGAGRARSIAQHHERRLGAILQVIRRQPRTAGEITDEVFGPELLHFQRRLALGEALAHLDYLVGRGEAERIENRGDAMSYVKTGRR